MWINLAFYDYQKHTNVIALCQTIVREGPSADEVAK